MYYRQVLKTAVLRPSCISTAGEWQDKYRGVSAHEVGCPEDGAAGDTKRLVGQIEHLEKFKIEFFNPKNVLADLVKTPNANRAPM